MTSHTIRRIPEGFRNAGGRLAIAMERCRHQLLGLLNKNGYRILWPSGLQLLENTWDLLPNSIRKRLIVLNSPQGEACCLRADITLAAVSHLASHYSPDEKPLRICYSDRLYRKPDDGGNTERFQIGAELLGWEGEGADVEILSLLIDGLARLGVDGVMVLSDAALVSEAMNSLGKEIRDNLLKALQDRSYRTYRYLASRVPGEKRKLLEALPELKGGPEILEEAEKLTGGVAIASLDRIFRSLSSMGKGDKIIFDLGSVRELDYYSGPIFDLYSSSSGRSMGGGGRYDGLLSSCGLAGQAVGFGLDLEELAGQSIYTNQEPIVAIWGGGAKPESAISLCPLFHQEDLTTEIIWSQDMENGKEIARAKGYRWWCRSEERTVWDLESEGPGVPLEIWLKKRRNEK